VALARQVASAASKDFESWPPSKVFGAPA
jgi:hypothetical protein